MKKFLLATLVLLSTTGFVMAQENHPVHHPVHHKPVHHHPVHHPVHHKPVHHDADHH